MDRSPAATLVSPSVVYIKRFRLIVSGHDDEGQSAFLTDQIAPMVMTVLQTLTCAVTNLWKVLRLPANNSVTSAKARC